MTGRYDASTITVLEGLEPVRRRPAMYIGSTGPMGVYNLVVEVVQNAVDEALAGHCRAIDVIVHTDGSVEVRDDGRGIPVDPLPDGRPAAEVVLSTLHAGGKFGSGAYHAAGGLHGVGISCVNALAATLDLEVQRDGGLYRARFSRGTIVSPLTRVGAAEARGTAIRFLPDPEIFPDTDVPEAQLAAWLHAQAFLNEGLAIRYDNRLAGVFEAWAYASGLAGFVSWLNREREPVHIPPAHLRGAAAGIAVDVALQWTHGYAEDVQAWVNGVHTTQGGTHVEGLRAALTQVINRYASAAKLLDGAESIAGYDVREGLTAVLSLRMVDPEFDGQTKAVLSTPGATAAVQQVVAERLEAWLAAHPAEAAAIVGRALEASRARAAARRASERARYQRVDFGFSRDVYREQFGIRSANWHASARWITDDAILKEHAAHCKVAPDAKLLDVCCGSGVVGNAFRGKVGHITGLDLTPQMVKLSRERLDVVVQGDVYHIPFPDASYDIVSNREVLHLLPNPERPVSEVFRVLKPGGQFVVGQWVPFSDVDAAWMFRIVKKKQPLFFNNLMAEDMHRLLADAGFVDIAMTEVLQWEDIDTWIDTWETSSIHRHQIRDLYHNAPAEVRAVHPFEISPEGHITDCWRWVIFSGWKPGGPPRTG
jgi:DNA gyrase subunit B